MLRRQQSIRNDNINNISRMGSDGQRKKSNLKRLRCYAVIVLGLILFIIVLHIRNPFSGSSPSLKPVPKQQADQKLDITSLQSELSKLDGCSLSEVKERKKSDGEKTQKRKPLWIASHPTSISDSLLSNVISQLTGLSTGAKSYYVSMRGKLKKCFGHGETVTCSVFHPKVEMSGGPDKKSDQFFEKFILVLRNPRTVLPAFSNEKASKYHGLSQGTQESEKKWKENRDQWFDNMITDWSSTIEVWKEAKNYQAGMYLTYEDMMDIKRGPSALKKLRSLLMDADFDVISEDEMSCLWYKSVEKKDIEQYNSFGYEYEEYLPSFTKIQKEKMMKALSDLIEKYEDDKELLTVLETYLSDIKQMSTDQ